MKRDKVQNTVIKFKDNDIDNEYCLDSYDDIKTKGNDNKNDNDYKNDYDKTNIIIVMIMMIIIMMIVKKIVKMMKMMKVMTIMIKEMMIK